MNIFFSRLLYLICALLAAPAYAGLAVSPSTPQHTHFDPNLGGDFLNPAQLTVRDTLSSTKACAAGYTRLGPNYCQAGTHFLSGAGQNAVDLVRDVCTTIAAPAADARGLLVFGVNRVIAANAVAARFVSIYAWSDSGCANTRVSGVYFGVAEQVATAAGTELGMGEQSFVVPLASSGSNTYLKMTDDVGNSGIGRYLVRGYYD